MNLLFIFIFIDGFFKAFNAVSSMERGHPIFNRI